MSDEQTIERRYLIVLRFDEDAAQMDVLGSIRAIKTKLEQATQGQTHLVFNSDDSYLVGLVVKTTMVAAQLRAMSEHTMQNNRGFAWAIEVGEDISALGNSSGWRWFQH